MQSPAVLGLRARRAAAGEVVGYLMQPVLEAAQPQNSFIINNENNNKKRLIGKGKQMVCRHLFHLIFSL